MQMFTSDGPKIMLDFATDIEIVGLNKARVKENSSESSEKPGK